MLHSTILTAAGCVTALAGGWMIHPGLCLLVLAIILFSAARAALPVASK